MASRTSLDRSTSIKSIADIFELAAKYRGRKHVTGLYACTASILNGVGGSPFALKSGGGLIILSMIWTQHMTFQLLRTMATFFYIIKERCKYQQCVGAIRGISITTGSVRGKPCTNTGYTYSFLAQSEILSVYKSLIQRFLQLTDSED
ncbi:hypothetical protein PoB_001933700 [Plakobranchus ocellatus]|uniref:Uncharacterized protein n=1 Tax=Plakobranchus ocellatus TaxID=259542 RepID=A0AAV3ZEE9_9GAST|nr:hypothetical protein PoB_001933700 [Plakobranchus ocellatus]